LAARNKLQDSDETPLELDMPDIHPAFEYLVGLFYLSGQCTPTGQGIVSLDWEKIHFFRRENQLDLDVWERGVIRSMSEAYVNEYYAATDPQRSAPYVTAREEIDVEAEARKAMSWRSIIRASGKK
jgi:hypothetical protein